MWVFPVLPLIIPFEYWWSYWYLIIRHRGIIDSILLEDVSFFICDLRICWLSWSRIYIQCFMIGFSLLQLLEIEWEWLHWYQWLYIYVRNFMTSYWPTWLIGDLEGKYIDDLIWVDYILYPDYSFHASIWLLILNIMIYLKNLTDYMWHLPDNYIVHVIIIAEKILLYGNTTLILYLYMSCYTGILFTDIIYHVILASWLHC